MHHYFRDHDQDAMTAAGMQRMVEDADATRRLFQEADAVTTEMTHAIFGKVGIGEERIAAEFERLLAEARLTDDGGTG
jgi:crotonobetainyl-CoA:carnitine CoA-transferase CaiB-like acyl-CoA transferase